DLILDAVGKPTVEEGLRCLAPFGHLILYGRAGGAPDPLSLATLFPKSLKVSAFSLPTVIRTLHDKFRESADRCWALIREGRLRIYIGRTFPLAPPPAAHPYIPSRQSPPTLPFTPPPPALHLNPIP